MAPSVKTTDSAWYKKPTDPNMGHTIPGCTDYSPNHKVVLKNLPNFAHTYEKRFRLRNASLAAASQRPHSYDDPAKRTFSRSNSGSFGRATRFTKRKDSKGLNKVSLMQTVTSPDTTAVLPQQKSTLKTFGTLNPSALQTEDSQCGRPGPTDYETRIDSCTQPV